jgi:hypothetical protein
VRDLRELTMFKRFFPTAILPIVISFNLSLASAGPAPEVWRSRYHGIGSGKESFLGMAVDEKGSVYVAGMTSSLAGTQFIVLKASEGKTDWVIREPEGQAGVLAIHEGDVHVSSPAEGGCLTRKYDHDGRSALRPVPPRSGSPDPAEWGR